MPGEARSLVGVVRYGEDVANEGDVCWTRPSGVEGGDPKVDARGVVSPAIVNLSKDKVGLLNGAGLIILSLPESGDFLNL